MKTKTQRILVTDDDPSMRLVVSLLLTQSGYTVMDAADGAEALQYFDVFKPDTLVTDLEMPRMCGEALIEELKLRDPNFPMLLITGTDLTERFLRLLRFPRLMVLRKPFDTSTLLSMVEQVRLLPEGSPRELRSSLRIPMELEVAIDSLGRGRTRNISLDGAFIESTALPAIGSKISLLFQTMRHTFTAISTVAWVRPDQGFGVRFDEISADSSETLHRLLRAELQIGHPLCVSE